MSRYMYALVRCVPNPQTGEFVNFGAIAGDPASGDWAVRQAGSDRHVRRLCTRPVIDAAQEFMGRVGDEAEARREAVEAGEAEPLDEQWLMRLHHDHRNVVQLSTPTPMVAEDPESALDVIFANMIIEPQKAPRGVTKSTVVSRMTAAYKLLAPSLVHLRPLLVIGDHINTKIDFAVANGSTLQLTQCWSFQRATDGIGTDVKAWAYALDRLRDERDAVRLVTGPNPQSEVGSDVDLQVLVARPKSPEQTQAYGEAEQIFRSLDAGIRSLDDADVVANRARELVDAHTGPRE